MAALADVYEQLHGAYEELAAVASDMADALLQIERNCPCGARPESLQTHPHVAQCPVAIGLRAWASLVVDPREGE